MRLSSYTLALVAALLASAGRAHACASCSCGDATLTATGVERPYKNRVRLAWEERYGSLVMGDDATGEHAQSLRSTLAASWSPLRRLTIGATLPWVSAWIRRGDKPSTSVNGLGDLELAARAVVFQERSFAPRHVLWLAAGLKLPTGYRVRDSSGYFAPADDQPGSGSWDPFGGVTYAFFSGNLSTLIASSTLRWTTPGWDGYRRGSSVGGSLLLQLQPWSWGALQVGADLLWSQADALANRNSVPNTGGAAAFVALGFMINPWRDLLLRVVVDAPVVMALNGTQSLGPQVVAQISYDFK